MSIIKFCFAQNYSETVRQNHESLLAKLHAIIETNGSFKEAVFLSEQGFENKISLMDYYYRGIKEYSGVIKKHSYTIKAKGYKQSDSTNYTLNSALFNVFCKYMPVIDDTSQLATSSPFFYNYDDPHGDKDFSSTFVTKLLDTHYGNCRSLSYLYKILAEEVGVKCWLSLAPNHIYIRNYSKQLGWYNTELTSRKFPTDAWIAASGYVNPDAIRSGLYMDTLSNQQAIGLCILDLLQGYIRQTSNYTDGLVIKGCDLVLQYHSVNPMALLLKGETLKRVYLKQKENSDPIAPETFNQMEEVYVQLIKLGYREMSKTAYQKWLKNFPEQKENFKNQDIIKKIEPRQIDSTKERPPLKAF